LDLADAIEVIEEDAFRQRDVGYQPPCFLSACMGTAASVCVQCGHVSEREGERERAREL
jgi:hypothetical protein